MRNIVLAGLLLGAAVPSFGHHPPCCEIATSRLVLTNRNVSLLPGESKTFYLPDGWRRVERVYVDAYSTRGSARLNVMVNGDIKGSLNVPEVDPSYIVAVHETTSSIQLWNRGYGTVTVQNLEVSVDSGWTHPIHVKPPKPMPKPTPFPSLNEAAKFAKKAVDLVDDLRPFADPETEFLTYLLPIKKVAGRALAQANAHGVGSKTVRDALEVLQRQIEFAEPYIELTLKKDAPFDLVVDLVSLKEAIKDWLD